jgi:hypothetical protein
VNGELHTPQSWIAACASLLCLAAALPGCGGDQPQQVTSTQSAGGTGATPETNDRKTETTSASKPRIVSTAQRFTPGHRVRAPGGAIYITPPRPTLYATVPSPDCVLQKESGRPVLRPPTPGLSARRTARRRVTVTYSFDSFTPRCTPDTIEVSVDVNRNVGGAYSIERSVNGREGTIEMGLPDMWSKADVVIARVRATTAIPGESAQVLIR